jgi:hypothetical protein
MKMMKKYFLRVWKKNNPHLFGFSVKIALIEKKAFKINLSE